MEHRSTAQDVHRCNLCENAIVHSYCDFCHVNLCKPCIGEHISDGYKKHAIVPFQERRSTLIYPKCAIHQQKNCDLQCKDCNIYICTSCVGSKQHREHDISELDDIYKAKKENIQKDAIELQNEIYPTYEEIAHDLEKQIANLDEGYAKLTNVISKHGEEWHTEIDIVISKMKSEISDIKVKHRDILLKHFDEIKKIQSLIQQASKALKEIEESNELSVAIEYNSVNKDFSKLPPKVKVSMPTFIPKPIEHLKLFSYFGHVTSLSTDTKQQVLVPKRPSKLSERKLLDEPEVALKIQTFQYHLGNIAYVNDENIWISGETDEVKCFNIRGQLLQTIITESGEWPSDIVVDSNGDLLYSTFESKTVTTVMNGQTKVLIRLQDWNPCQLCVTFTGELLVSMFSNDYTQSKVVRYSGSTKKQTIQFNNEGKPLYSGNNNIKYITENRNHDICVADCLAGAIVVVDQYGKLRFRYTGHAIINIENGSFEPYGIATDSESRILTVDRNLIQILDQNGQFLHCIYNCDLEDLWGLCLDDDDNLFVCEYASGNVKKIKYLV